MNRPVLRVCISTHLKPYILALAQSSIFKHLTLPCPICFSIGIGTDVLSSQFPLKSTAVPCISRGAQPPFSMWWSATSIQVCIAHVLAWQDSQPHLSRICRDVQHLFVAYTCPTINPVSLKSSVLCSGCFGNMWTFTGENYSWYQRKKNIMFFRKLCSHFIG